MSEKVGPELVTVFHVKRKDNYGYWALKDEIEGILNDIKELDIGDELIIKKRQVTVTEYENCHEFEGW